MVALQVGRKYEITLPPNTPLVPTESKAPIVIVEIMAVSADSVLARINGDDINISKKRIWEARKI